MKAAALRQIHEDDVERARRAWSQGAAEQARKLLQRHLQRHPEDAAAWHLYGVVALGTQQPVEAANRLLKALEIDHGNADIWCDLGTALHAQGARERSQEAYVQALNLKPGHLDAIFNLGNLLREVKQLKDALQLYSALLEANPSYRYAWSNTGLVLLELGHLDEARKCFEREIELDAGNAGAHVNLGHVLRELGRVEEAIAVYRKGLLLAPRYAELHLNMGVALNALGDTRAAIVHLREAVRLKPGYEAAHHSLIFTLDFDERSSTRTQQEARRDWYRHCARQHEAHALQPLRDTDPERVLRIGYVSADFRLTSAAMTFAPMLLQYDHARFEVYCYSNSVHEDRLTARMRQACAGFEFIGGMTDAQAAQRIARDRIDILVDLSGHMQGNRLGLFVYRPAPVQITAWGYANGSGVPAMDYILADAVYLPDEVVAHFAEKRLDVPAVIPYHPFDALPALAPVPPRRVRLGCFSRWQKLNEATVRLWAAVLQRNPEAELVLKTSQELDQRGVDAMRARFLAHGVEAHRLQFLPRAGWTAHLESFAQIDIQLDPFPHGGGISLLDGVAMGVPSLTLLGDTPPARLGTSLMQAIGAEAGWVARTPEEYVELASHWCAQIEEVRAGRATLREKLLRSPLGDTVLYVRAVEAAYRRAWKAAGPPMRSAREAAVRKVSEALERNQPDSVRGLISTLEQNLPQDAQVLHLAGTAALQRQDLDTALQRLSAAVALDERRAEAWTNLGVVLTRLGRHDEAIQALQRAVQIEPASALSQHVLGCIQLDAHHLPAAKLAFEQALAADPRHLLALNNLGVVHERLGDLGAAEQHFTRVLAQDPGSALGNANLGRTLVDSNRVQAAIPHLERALQVAPDMHWLRYELGVWYERLGLAQRLASLAKYAFKPIAGPFKVASTGNPGTPSGEQSARVLSDPAVFDRITACVREALRQQGMGPEAQADELLRLCGRLMEVDHPAKNRLLDEALELNPSNLGGYLKSGISLHHDAEYEAASARWKAGLRIRDEKAQAAGLLDVPHRLLDPSWYMAVGHLQMLDCYLKSVALGMRDPKSLWLVRTTQLKVPNEAYLKYWKPWINVDAEIRGTSNLEALSEHTGVPTPRLPLITDHFFADRVQGRHEMWHMEFAAHVQGQWEAQGRAPLLQLLPEDIAFGRETLTRLGLPQDAWYVCLHAREPGFWSKWDRHHPSIRNAHIDAYAQAIDRVLARGGWVIRMGDPSMRPLPPQAGVIDYAHSPYKSERMDVFLCGSARVFIGVNSGLSLLPPTFGRPCLLTNYVPISIPFPYGQDRMLPKLFRSRRDGHLLSFDEMFEHGVADAQFAHHVPDWIEVLDNDPQDIAVATDEMLDEIGGTLDPASRQRSETLRQRYATVLRQRHQFLGTPPGGRFLERYAQLLD